MIKTYAILAWRSLKKHKFLSAINIMSPSIDISAFVVIVWYIIDELIYDAYQEKTDRIF